MKLLLFVFLSLGLIADSSFDVIPDINIENIEKYNLGKKLFHDKNLSKDKKISCATCHPLNQYGTDNLTVYRGVNNSIGGLNSPTIYNSKFNIAQDGGGLAYTIKERAKLSFLNTKEMAGNITATIHYINSDNLLYDQFKSLYGEVNEDAIFDSIAYFVENLLTPNSKFDRFIKGEKSIFNSSELRGYVLFQKYGCISCHNGLNIGGNMYQKLGIFSDFSDDGHGENDGRYNVTNKENDKNVFKVPSLRNIEKTLPYLHDGSIPDLRSMIQKMAQLQLGMDIPKNDIYDIEQFLMTLTGDI